MTGYKVFETEETKNELIKSGAIYVDEGVLFSDKIITTRGLENVVGFAIVITKVIKGEGGEFLMQMRNFMLFYVLGIIKLK